MNEDRFIPRDISWLSFNYRVLMEAKDKRVPLLERLRFLAIYSSNLDEFVRVRVANIRNLIRIDKKKINKSIDIKPKKVLKAISKEINSQLDEFGRILRKEVLPALEKEGIIICNGSDITEKHQKEIRQYFRSAVMAYLRPYIDGRSKASPFLKNQGLYLAVRMGKGVEQYFGYVNIPSDSLPRFCPLFQLNGQHYFIMLDDIIKLFVDDVFPGFEVKECRAIKLNRDADLQIEDEYSGDLVEKIRKQITKRDIGIPSRFLYDSNLSEELLKWLIDRFELEEEDLVPGGSAHNLSDYFQLPNPVGKHLEYEPFPPLWHKDQPVDASLFETLALRDLMLHFPYHSYDHILQLFNEASIHPDVRLIQVSFYRMAANSLIGEALISAAGNGKEVIVFMEVKARFDEENNLKWAHRFQEAGIKVVYSIPGLKVHAKIALITMSSESEKRYYVFLGTGNLNEKTARIYADHGLLTSDNVMGKELEGVFNYLLARKPPVPFNKLLVSQFNMMEEFIRLIDYEIEAAKENKKARIIIKLNNLEEKTMINKLYEASEAGVRVDLIVRGISCLKPGVPGMSENIAAKRLVDRYLEHARIFVFHHDGLDLTFLGSADWMNRNLHSRIEVAFPIADSIIKEEIFKILDYQLNDNVKVSILDGELNNLPATPTEATVRAQFDTYRWLCG